jgi:hypothetical protein
MTKHRAELIEQGYTIFPVLARSLLAADACSASFAAPAGTSTTLASEFVALFDD